MNDLKKIKLPEHITPEKYLLQFKPDLVNFVFEGNETITIHIKKPTRTISLHSKELEIKLAELFLNKEKYSPINIVYDQKAETVTFLFKTSIRPGKYSLKILFKGILSDSMRGFYRSSYTHENERRHMATTQFEATDARRAFPCFDEPAHKAIFEVSLVVPNHTTAISNTIETSIAEHQAGYKIIQFAPSPKMSTYLLAFIIGEFEYVETKTKHGVRVRVYTTPGKKHQAMFALKTAADCLDFYDNYFDIPYPLPVLDLIAIPDFTSAAMENWGAITYRETALLVDEKNSSTANKQWVAIVIAHEIAHQWFGNLVTMHWWTDLWLNEGFASYMEHFAVDALFPEWEIWKQFVSGRLNTALNLDSLQNTHPIEVPVHHPDEINEIFDQISYAKGASVIRMLASYLGEKNFKNGLRHYLKKHSYKNTVTEDLWESFEKISKKPIKKIMSAWTKRPGYPLVTITGLGKNIVLTQQRYYGNNQINKKQQPEKPWPIPLAITNNKNSFYNQLFESKKLLLKDSKKLFKLNPGETSFIRVVYEPEFLNRLQPIIINKNLPAVDRLGIIRDVFSTAESGLISTTAALKTASWYIKEDELVVWEEVATNLQNIRFLLEGQDFYELFEKFCLTIFAPLAQKYGWNKKRNESHSQSLLRSLSLGQAGLFGHTPTIAKAKKLFSEIKKNKHVSADLKSVIYNLVSRYGGLKEQNDLFQLYRKSAHMHEEQERVGRSLGQFKNSKLIEKTLKFSMGPYVRPQDSPTLFASAARNPQGRPVAWKFLKQNWKKIYNRYNQGGHLLEWYIASFKKCNTAEELNDFRKFFSTAPHKGIERVLKQTMEIIESNIAWLKRDRAHIKNWLNQNVKE